VFGDGDLCVAPKRRLLAGQEVMEAARRASGAKGEVTVDGGRFGRWREGTKNRRWAWPEQGLAFSAIMDSKISKFGLKKVHSA
jgi:hypothetical protein